MEPLSRRAKSSVDTDKVTVPKEPSVDYASIDLYGPQRGGGPALDQQQLEELLRENPTLAAWLETS